MNMTKKMLFGCLSIAGGFGVLALFIDRIFLYPALIIAMLVMHLGMHGSHKH